MRNAVLISAVLSLLPLVAAAQENARPHLVVRSGAQIVVFKTTAINPDCSSAGRFTINLIRSPQGGQAGVSELRDYVSFLPINPRSACNHRKVAATEILYRSAPGYSGYDTFSAEIIAPSGFAYTREFTVEVR